MQDRLVITKTTTTFYKLTVNHRENLVSKSNFAPGCYTRKIFILGINYYMGTTVLRRTVT